MAKIMIKQLNQNWVMLENIYKISFEQLDKLLIDAKQTHEERENRDVLNRMNNQYTSQTSYEVEIKDDIFDLLENNAKNKIDFINKSPKIDELPMFLPFMSDLFMYSELEEKKDALEFGYKEFLKFIKTLSEVGIITSVSKYGAYCTIIERYTKWAYDAELRKDYISLPDLTKKLPYSKVVKHSHVENTVMTFNEMRHIINLCDKKHVKIALLATLEGLKLAELLSIKIDAFKSDDRVIDVESRLVEVSEELFIMMKEYANTWTVKRSNPYNEFEMYLVDTGYLIRPMESKRNNTSKDKMTQTAFLQNAKNELKGVGYNIDIRMFRNSAILNDALDGKLVEYINEKYNKKYVNIAKVVAERIKVETLEHKRRKEETLVADGLNLKRRNMMR